MKSGAMGGGELPRNADPERKATRRNGAERDDVQDNDDRVASNPEGSLERVQIPFLRERLSRNKVDLRRYESFASELVLFSPPPCLPPDHAKLVVNIVVLDHRSLHAFGAHSSTRAEVKALLQNAVITAGYQLGADNSTARREHTEVLPAIGLYNQAEEVFLRHLQARNRLHYLMGVALGILFLIAVSSARWILPDGLVRLIPDLTAITFFAGLGSIVSVLLRLSELDVVKEISRGILLVSGTGRPLVASAFALIICVAISSGLVAISIGNNQKGNGVYLAVAFLCGFSERFAKDLLERVERTPSESQRSEHAR